MPGILLEGHYTGHRPIQILLILQDAKEAFFHPIVIVLL